MSWDEERLPLCLSLATPSLLTQIASPRGRRDYYYCFTSMKTFEKELPLILHTHIYEGFGVGCRVWSKTACPRKWTLQVHREAYKCA
jgi:hypothetical protein